MTILVFDPSGNYNEGKGTTGFAQYYNNKLIFVGQIRAESFDSQHEYWEHHSLLIDTVGPDVVVIENYKLFASTKDAQINSELETSQLIGVLKFHCTAKKIHVRLQEPQIKHRFSNEILLRKKIISQDKQKRYYAVGVPISRHIIDAIRHGEYYINFKLKKESFYDSSNKDNNRAN